MLTALPDASVDVVVAAQSFHRFTNRAALEEIHRVLVPNGAFGTLWKLLDLSIPWAKQLTWPSFGRFRQGKFISFST